MTVAILGAMQEEVESLVQAMDVREHGMAGRRKWWRGALLGADDVLIAFSHWGKVASASTATWMIARHDIQELLFTGVAGALSPNLSRGDVVVGNRLWQHDFDARPLLARHEIPLLGTAALPTDDRARARLATAANGFVAEDFHRLLPAALQQRHQVLAPKVVVADIASGDRFVHDKADANDIRARLPDVVCVEMEGAAVAQVCAAFDTPFSIVRTISDNANSDAAVDFKGFVDDVARVYASGIVVRWLQLSVDQEGRTSSSSSKVP